jgi:hypothetical protein
MVPRPGLLLIPLQLSPSPMLVLHELSNLARAIEHPLNVTVQSPHDADAREHRWPAERRDQDQDFLLGTGQSRQKRLHEANSRSQRFRQDV